MNKKLKPNSVGPHEGRELALMLAGVKPLSMFVEPVDCDFELFPEEEFDKLVLQQKLKKRVSIEKSGKTDQPDMRRVLYSLPGDEWRIDAMILVQQLYATLLPGWRPDLERVIGLLLGYERVGIESFVKWIQSSQ